MVFGGFLDRLPPYVLKQCLSVEPRACQVPHLNLEMADSACLASQLASETPQPPLLSNEIAGRPPHLPNIYMGAGDLNLVLILGLQSLYLLGHLPCHHDFKLGLLWGNTCLAHRM